MGTFKYRVPLFLLSDPTCPDLSSMSTATISHTTLATTLKYAQRNWGLLTWTILGFIYHDRALFDKKRPDIYQDPGWPILGNIPDILAWVPYFHEFGHDVFTRMDELTV